MIIVKFEPRTPKSLEAMVNYMFDHRKTDDECIFGIGINPRFCKYELWFPWKYFNITPDEITHPYVQVIVSLDEMPVFIKSQWTPIFHEIGCALITDRRQVIGSIHFKGKGHVHCHYLINYVSVEGKLYRQVYLPSHYRQIIEKIVPKNFQKG